MKSTHSLDPLFSSPFPPSPSLPSPPVSFATPISFTARLNNTTLCSMLSLRGIALRTPVRMPGISQGSARSALAVRAYAATRVLSHGGPKVDKSTAKQIRITFIPPKSDPVSVMAYSGQTLLQIAHSNDGIDLEGACEGVCACSTCHCILPDDLYDALPFPSEDEEDMLDLAFGLTPTSRLGCQVVVNEDMDGASITLPAATRNFYVDGHVPIPH